MILFVVALSGSRVLGEREKAPHQSLSREKFLQAQRGATEEEEAEKNSIQKRTQRFTRVSSKAFFGESIKHHARIQAEDMRNSE